MSNKILTLHHFAASGGTVISKILSTGLNVCLLNEVHPQYVNFNPKSFSPTTLMEEFFVRYGNLHEGVDELLDKKFISDLSLLVEDKFFENRILILRDWTHGDFFERQSNRGSYLCDLLNISPLKTSLYHPLVTIRNPIDNFLSGCRSGFFKAINDNFDVFCALYLEFYNHYKSKGSIIIKYEDIINKTDNFQILLDQEYGIKFPENYRDLINRYNFSGDSGRSSGDLQVRPRRDEDLEIASELKTSDAFKILNQFFEYDEV